MKIHVLLAAVGILGSTASAAVSPSTFGKGSKSPKGSKSTILPKETKSSSFSPGKGSRLPGNNSTAPTMAPTTMTIDEVAGSSSFPLRLRGRRMTRRRLHRSDGTGHSALKKKNKGSSPKTPSKSSKGTKSSCVGKNTTTAAPTPFPTLEDTEFNP